MYFAAKDIGSSHIRSLLSQSTTGSMPVCSMLNDQAITRKMLSNVPGHMSDFLQTVIKYLWFFVTPRAYQSVEADEHETVVVGELSSIAVQAARNELSFVSSQQFWMVPQNVRLLQFVSVPFGCSKVASDRRFPQARPLTETTIGTNHEDITVDETCRQDVIGMRAHVNSRAPPGYPSAALRERWKFCGCAGDDNDGNWLTPCAVAPPMISATSLAETLPLPHFSLRVSIKGFFAPDPAPLSATRRRIPPLRCELELLWPSNHISCRSCLCNPLAHHHPWET